MNIISVLTFCTLLLFIQGIPYNEGYYAGFNDVLGIDAFSTNDGIDCTEPVNRALHQFRDSISFGNRDSRIFLQAAADLIDKLKFEVSPLCRTFYGDFNDFITVYYGDVEQIKSLAERNLDDHSALIEKVVRDSLTALQLGDDYENGKGHAYLLKLLLDLEKNEEKTINTTQELPEPAKEETVKVEQTVEEKVQEVKVEPVVTVVKEEKLSLDEERIVALTEDVTIKEKVQELKVEPAVTAVKEEVMSLDEERIVALTEDVVIKEEIGKEVVQPVQVDVQVNGSEFNKHMDYNYAEIVGVATEEKTDEDEDKDVDAMEVETMMSQDESEDEEDEDEDEDEEDEDEGKEMEEEEDEEDEDDDKVEVVEREAQVEEEEEDSDQDESVDDVVASLSPYDSEVNAVQKRVLSQDYHYNYDL